MAIGNMVAFGDPARARSNIAAWNLINQVNGLNREIAIRQLRLATGKQQPRMEDGASFFAVWNKMRKPSHWSPKRRRWRSPETGVAFAKR